MMKVAYLMNGVIGGLSGKNYQCNDIDIQSEIVKYSAATHKYLKSDNVDIDYFIFSWESHLHDTYANVYNPKRLVTADQKIFEVPEHYASQVNNPRVQSHYSRWYGCKEVYNLMLDYKKETGIEYDLVINARLDLCYHMVIDLSQFTGNQFYIGYYLNAPFYNWPKKNEMCDHFFASSEENMSRVSKLYDHINEYTKPGQCPRYELISNHFLIVWHLRKLGLLETNIINEVVSSINNGYGQNTHYHIFRYQNLTKEELLTSNKII